METSAAFIVQVHKVELKHNGGRVQMDFGLDAVDTMAEIAKLAAIKDMNFKIVICVLDPREV